MGYQIKTKIHEIRYEQTLGEGGQGHYSIENLEGKKWEIVEMDHNSCNLHEEVTHFYYTHICKRYY